MRIQFSIPNLAYRTDRYQATLNNLLEQEVPRDDIHITQARNGLTYSLPEDMWEDAVCTLDYLRDVSLKPQRWANGDIGYIWSCFEILDTFLASDYEYLYFNQDDRPLLITYSQLIALIQEVLDISKDFKIIKLMKNNRKAKRQHAKMTYPIGVGIAVSGDSGIILSKRGATDIHRLSRNTGNFIEYCVHMIIPKETTFVATENIFIGRAKFLDDRHAINQRRR